MPFVGAPSIHRQFTTLSFDEKDKQGRERRRQELQMLNSFFSQEFSDRNRRDFAAQLEILFQFTRETKLEQVNFHRKSFVLHH